MVSWLKQRNAVRKVVGSIPSSGPRLEISPCSPSSKWVPVGQLSCCDTGIIIIATLL